MSKHNKEDEEKAIELLSQAAELIGWTVAIGGPAEGGVDYVILGIDEHVETLVDMIEVARKGQPSKPKGALQ